MASYVKLTEISTIILSSRLNGCAESLLATTLFAFDLWYNGDKKWIIVAFYLFEKAEEWFVSMF